MSMALQQGGLGMVLSALILTAPPMAGAFFNGVMGQFSSYNAFPGNEFRPANNGGGGGGYPAPGGPPPSNSAPRQAQDRGRYTDPT